MRKTLVGGAIVCAMFVVFEAGPAQAQEREDERDGASRPAVEVTPFVSMGSARSSRIGAAIAFAWTEKLSIEAEMGYRKGEGDLNFLNSSASLLYALPRIGRANPYLAAGVGLEQYGTGEHIPGYGVATLRQTALTVNAGGGVKVPISGPIGFGRQVVRPSGRQAVRSSGRQAVRSSGRQVVRPSGRQAARLSG